MTYGESSTCKGECVSTPVYTMHVELQLTVIVVIDYSIVLFIFSWLIICCVQAGAKWYLYMLCSDNDSKLSYIHFTIKQERTKASNPQTSKAGTKSCSAGLLDQIFKYLIHYQKLLDLSINWLISFL